MSKAAKKTKTTVPESTDTESPDAPAADTQVRVHWLAASHRASPGLQQVKEMIQQHADVASVLFQGLVRTAPIVFRNDDGSPVKPLDLLLASLRPTYKVQRDTETVLVTKDDVIRCLTLATTAVNGGQATNVAVFASADPALSEPLATLLAQLRALESVDSSWSVVGKLDINLRKFVWLVLSAAGVLPALADLEGYAAKSVLANVQGKYKSLQACADTHAALYKQHQTNKEQLEKLIADPGFVALCFALLQDPDLRSVDSRRLAALEEMLGFVAADKNYSEYTSTRKCDGWAPPSNMFELLCAHKEAVRRNIVVDNSKCLSRRISLVADGDVNEVSVFELLNEMRWLSVHSSGIRMPNYPKHAYALKFGDNYISVKSFETVVDGGCSVLRMTARVGKNDLVCDFVLGRGNEYWNNLKITPMGKGIFEVVKTVRRFTTTGAKLVELRGVCKEPEIRYERGVLGLRLPISFGVDGKVEEDSIAFGKNRVSMRTTPFAEKADKFQGLLDYRNTTARAGYIYYAGFDQGENDQVVGIYRTSTYKNATMSEFFKVSDTLEEVVSCRFSEYQDHKRGLRGETNVLDINSINVLADKVHRLRRLVSTLRACTSHTDWYPKLKERRRLEWDVLAQGVDVSDFDTEIERAEAALSAVDAVDFVRDPTCIINVLDQHIYAQFKRMRSERNEKYRSQHQHDYKWLQLVDSVISLRKSIYRFGKAPEPRGSGELYPQNLYAYRDNLMQQYRKEVAAFIRDVCLEHGVQQLAVEALNPTSYIGEDSDANRKRALFAPSELHNDIVLACSLHSIAVVAVDETLTSRVAPNGRLGFRSHGDYQKFSDRAQGRFNWKHLHYFGDNDVSAYCDADENACRNIVLRAITCGASKPRFSRQALLGKKKGPVLQTQLAYLAHKRGLLMASTDHKKAAEVGFDLVESDLGGTLRAGKGFVYVDASICINATTRKERSHKVGEAVVSRSLASPF